MRDFTAWERTLVEGAVVLSSPELTLPVPANEVVVSWNADAPAGTGLEVEARGIMPDHATKWYSMGRWSKDDGKFPRASVSGQKDADGDVDTDTLVLTQPAPKIQLRVTLRFAPPAVSPTLKFIGISALDTRAAAPALDPNRAAWGKEVAVPSRTQLGWPGGRGWCSPTSTDMALAFWSKRLARPELDLPVPDAAHAIHDRVFGGTGNWPFNTAFAGSFPGMRAYVSRFGDIRELEDWVESGIPPIVSVSYAILKNQDPINDPGHLMVCDGFDQKGDIVLNDPAYHADKGERCRRVFPRADFLKAWAKSRNTVYLIYPEGAKIPANRYGDWEAQP
ncbi:MAG TPA: C39 family peptidase [Chthonomonadaceae bacterium]|nr:C39 family peptidase [Chthonomonadaceae bacterium]